VGEDDGLCTIAEVELGEAACNLLLIVASPTTTARVAYST